jgi:hypothetical protein
MEFWRKKSKKESNYKKKNRVDLFLCTCIKIQSVVYNGGVRFRWIFVKREEYVDWEGPHQHCFVIVD